MQSFPLSHFQACTLPQLTHSQRNVANFIQEVPFPRWGSLLPGWSREGLGRAGSVGRAGNAAGAAWDYAMATAPSRLQLSLMWEIPASISKQTSPRAALKSGLIETQPSHKIQLIILVRPEGCVHTSIIGRAGKAPGFPSDCGNRGNSSAERGFQWFWCQIRADFIKSRSSELL